MRPLVPLVMLGGLLVSSAGATQRVIVQSTLGQTLLQTTLNTTCVLVGGLLDAGKCKVIESLGDPAGQLFLIGLPDGLNLGNLLNALLQLTGILVAEVDQVVSLLESSPLLPQPAPIPQSVSQSMPVTYFGTTVWQGYVAQPAAQIVGIAAAQSTYNVSGAGTTVAVIDTGVDPNQPVLAPVLDTRDGYDFTTNTAGGSDTLTASDSDVWVVNPTDPQVAAFGHGTMVSGVVHLVAPTASIMPLRAFQVNGSGYTSDVIRAIYWAVGHNARVINISAGTSQPSLALGVALTYATSVGAIVVTAAGNDNSSAQYYPAANSTLAGPIIGVASTNNNDILSTFSNHGSWVWLAAPGEAIVTTYPVVSGSCGWCSTDYAEGWGTSFSTPFVSGAVSLLLQANSALSQAPAANAVGNAAQPAVAGVDHGRLGIVQALQSIN